jgi:hypothetical protein
MCPDWENPGVYYPARFWTPQFDTYREQAPDKKAIELLKMIADFVAAKNNVAALKLKHGFENMNIQF